MKITKFFRRYSRQLLMVFMSLLLVAFLIPSTLQNIGERGRVKLKWGEAYGHSITNNDLEGLQADVRVLNLPVRLEGVRRELRLYDLLGLPPPHDEAALDFYLLREEARRVGVRVGRSEAAAWLKRIGFAENEVSQLASTMRCSPEELVDTAAQWIAVGRLLGVQGAAMFESLPRQELKYRDSTQMAVADLSVLDVKALVYLVPEPTDEELQKFFDECKGRTTKHTEDQLEFGYLLPDRVQIEYLTISPEKVLLTVKVKASQVEQFYNDHKDRYMKPDPMATQPVQGRRPQVQMTLEEAKEKVRADVRLERAIDIAQSLVNQMHDEAHLPWNRAERDADSFAVPPPEAENVSFEKLKEKYSTTYEIDYGLTELLDQKALQGIPRLGRAGAGGGMTVADLAFRVKGILTDTKDGRPVLSVLEPAPVALTDLGTRSPQQAYLFRVVAVAPSAPPESLDPMRAQVVEDWKLSRAFELAHTYAENLAARSRELGLTAAVEQDSELNSVLAAAQTASQPAGTPPAPRKYVEDLQPAAFNRLTRADAYDRRLGTGVPGVAKAFFDVVDKPASATLPAHRVVCVPVANRFKWAVGELNEVKPIYAGAFQKQLLQTAQQNQQNDLQLLSMLWPVPDNVEQRTGFKPGPALEGRQRRSQGP